MQCVFDKKKLKNVPVRSGLNLDEKLKQRLEKKEGRVHAVAKAKPTATVTSASAAPEEGEEDPFKEQFEALQAKSTAGTCSQVQG